MSEPTDERSELASRQAPGDPRLPEEGVPRPVRGLEIAPGIHLGGDDFPVIVGPCVLESEDLALGMADFASALGESLGVPVIFKSSFDKANRSSGSSYRGPGLEAGLKILRRVRETTGLPILTDVHEADQCEAAAEVCDVLQIPAFLCRQTDLIRAAARTGKSVNIKKGQFLAPDDVLRAVEKARAIDDTRVDDPRVFVTERGYSFGYHDLVVDMRAFAEMQSKGIPVIFDATHSLQLPGGGEVTGGARRFAEPLARAAVAAGADGLFMEVHPTPGSARSDATTQLPPERAELLLESLLAVRAAVLPHLQAGRGLAEGAGAEPAR